jgi:DNA-directed RNA polymerase subunit omega
MARISAQDCLDRLPNRFALCILAAKRARQLAAGDRPLVVCDNKVAVTSLREIAAGRITAAESVDQMLREHIAETNALNAHRTSHGVRDQVGNHVSPRLAAAKASAK